MATYYVSSVDGSNSDNGTTWDLAVATLEYAVETLAATSGPHTILVDSAHNESLSADTTITAAQDLRIISVNRSGSDAPLAGAVIGAQSTNYSFTLNGAWDVYVYGIQFSNGTGNTVKYLTFNNTDGGHFEFESCTLYLTDTSTTESPITINAAALNSNNFTKFKDCTFRFSTATDALRISAGRAEFIGCTVSDSGTLVNFLFSNRGAAHISVEGCDVTNAGNTALYANQTDGTGKVTFTNCKVRSAVVPLQIATVLNRGNAEVWMFNCASDDTHYNFYHGDAFGETTVVTTYYADDGASYDGTNRVAWKIVTRANNCSFYTPYVSPWIEQYNADTTTSIQPWLEGLRVDSTTIIQNDEVWAEFSFQDSTDIPQAVLSNDRMALLGSAADQTSSLAYTAWTGSPTDTDSGDSTFKLQAPAAVTPNEIGPIKARVIVGEAGLTVYIDPKIRT